MACVLANVQPSSRCDKDCGVMRGSDPDHCFCGHDEHVPGVTSPPPMRSYHHTLQWPQGELLVILQMSLRELLVNHQMHSSASSFINYSVLFLFTAHSSVASSVAPSTQNNKNTQDKSADPT